MEEVPLQIVAEVVVTLAGGSGFTFTVALAESEHEPLETTTE